MEFRPHMLLEAMFDGPLKSVVFGQAQSTANHNLFRIEDVDQSRDTCADRKSRACYNFSCIYMAHFCTLKDCFCIAESMAPCDRKSRSEIFQRDSFGHDAFPGCNQAGGARKRSGQPARSKERLSLNHKATTDARADC